MRTRVSGSQNDETAKLAYKIVDDFSESLIKDLQPIGFPLTGELPPAGSLAVQGDFLLIDEGNTARRTAIGLGASKVEVRVECYLKQTDNNVIVTEFTSESFEEAWPRGNHGSGRSTGSCGYGVGGTDSNKAPKVTRIDWRKPSQRKSEKRWQPKAG